MAGFREQGKFLVIGVLAQLVEQRTFNPFVVGSIPAHPTKQKAQSLTGLFYFTVCALRILLAI